VKLLSAILVLLAGLLVGSCADVAVPDRVPRAADLGWEPVLISRPEPIYPPEYARAGVEGVVTLSFVVFPDGSVGGIKVVKSPDFRLTMLAASALKQSRYIPSLSLGAVASEPQRMPFVFGPTADVASGDSGRAAAILAKGEEAMKRGQYMDAIADCTEALRLDPNVAVAYTVRGLAHWARGEYTAAIADCGRALALDPANGPAYSLRGQCELSIKDYIGAVHDFDAAIRLLPETSNFYEQRGAAYLSLHRDEEGLDDLDQAIQFQPGNARAHYLRGLTLYQRGNYEGAKDDLAKAIQLIPTSYDALNMMGWLLAVCPEARFRDGKQAVIYATEACAITGSKNPALLDTLAAAEAEAGKFEQAIRSENQALQAGPVSHDIPDMRARIGLYRQKKAYRAPEPDIKANAWDDLRYHTFQTVWTTVNESYFDPKFGGVDWAAVREKYRMQLPQAADEARLRWLLQSMLEELHHTHFAILPRESAVFDPADRVRIGTIGAELAFIGDRVVFTEMRPHSPGTAAGLKPGDAVSRLDGIDLDPLFVSLEKAGDRRQRAGLYLTQFVESRLSGPVGARVNLRVIRADGKTLDAAVVCGPTDGVWSEPIGTFPSVPIRSEARRDPDGIASLRFNAFVPQVMKDIRTLLISLHPGDGLIVDLRGNGGGVTAMAAGISGRLCRREFSLGAMYLRKGVENFEVYPQSAVFDGPIAILVDGQSASTSEIFAAGLQAAHRARVFGERTAGAALPSAFKRLPNDDLLQYAIADMTTPAGFRIEGEGITPDETVLRTCADLAAGRDPVAAAARAWLVRQRRPQ
jgi:carboxyl-terminal processing protease